MDALQARTGLSDIAFSKHVGFSRQLLYLLRSGKQGPSRNTLRLLDMAERAAGTPTPGPAPTHDIQRLEVREDRAAYGTPTVGTSSNSDLRTLEEIESGLAAMREMLTKLTAAVKRMKENSHGP